MPIYSSSSESSEALQRLKAACEVEAHAVQSLLDAMQGGADLAMLRKLTVAMEHTGFEKMRIHDELQKYAIGE